MSATLLPHVWDDEKQRLAIHLAFDRWFLAFECTPKATRQEQFWRMRLKKLTDEAKWRLFDRERQQQAAEALREATASAEAVGFMFDGASL